MKQDKVDIVAAHIARSIVNDAIIMINEEDDFEYEESDEEYRDVKMMSVTVRVTMTARTTIIVIMTTTTMTTTKTTAVVVLEMMSMKATMMITVKKCK